MLTVLLLIVFAACVASLWNQGLWGNALMLVNVVFAGLFAVNYFEPVAAAMEASMPSYSYFWDFLSLWFLFAAACGVLRILTDLISRHRVRFRLPVEHVGRVFFAACVGWVVVCFTCMTLHTAPLPQTAFRGSFEKEPMSNNFLGMAPDRKWLALIQSRSRGALSKMTTAEFDPKSDFIFKYGGRRARLEENVKETGSLRVRTGSRRR